MTVNMVLNLKFPISRPYKLLISLFMPGANNGLFTPSFMGRIEQTYSLINIQLALFLLSVSGIGILFHFDLGGV